jgi:hypothetical protein
LEVLLKLDEDELSLELIDEALLGWALVAISELALEVVGSELINDDELRELVELTDVGESESGADLAPPLPPPQAIRLAKKTGTTARAIH